MDRVISTEIAATEWAEGMPLGNGHMGAMVYGGVLIDEIDLSENTFFSGELSLDNNQKKAGDAFLKMRELLQQDNYKDAYEEASKFIGIKQNYGTNLPVGKLILTHDLTDNVSEYKRELNISKGIAKVSFLNEDVSYTRETLISHPEKKLLYYLTCDKEDGLNFSINFIGGRNPYHKSIKDNVMYFEVDAFEKLHSDGKTGVHLIGSIAVDCNGGDCSIRDGELKIRGAHSCLITIQMQTDFLYEKEADTKNFLQSLHIEAVPVEKYMFFRKEHCEDIYSYMKRVEFSLCGSDDTLENLFYMGRYLLLSSSREDSILPAHLQGIWNDDVACRIGWTCDMHLDINTQMNYWLAESGNLSSCCNPLFRWIEEKLIPSGRKTARESYNMPGWSADLVSNAWGFSAPYWSRTISPCPTGGSWTISAYMEHYRYSKDYNFLKTRAYPVLREAVEFFSIYVFPKGEYYTSGPSISPENSFLYGNDTYYFSNGCTYEILMIRELFIQYLEASKELEISDDLTRKVEIILPKLLPYRILENGTLAEWDHNYPAADKQHRHTSHLLGLYPFSQITPEKTPELSIAATKSIEEKLIPYENWEDTGWARSLLMLYSARLKRGNDAYDHMCSMLKHLTKSSLLVMHPPTRGAASFKEVYELDGNTGFSTCIIEMLMQSHDGVIQLLPALPDQWKDGKIKGIVARGNITLHIEWKNSELCFVEFHSSQDGLIQYRYKETKRSIYLEKGKSYRVTIKDFVQ